MSRLYLALRTAVKVFYGCAGSWRAGALARAVMHDTRWAVRDCHGLGSVVPLHVRTPARPRHGRRRIGWAHLLARVFAVCRTCGGRIRILDVVTDPGDIGRIVHSAGAPPRPPRPHPPGQLCSPITFVPQSPSAVLSCSPS